MSSNPEIEQKRKALQLENKAFEDNLMSEVNSLKGKAVDIGKYALVAGGLAVVGVIVAKFVYTMIVGDDDEDQTTRKSQIIHLPVENQASLVPVVRESKEQPVIVKLIMGAITTFLLSIAKQKLTQFLEQLYAKEADKDSKPAA